LAIALYRYPWKLITEGDGEMALYNVKDDPLEMTDLADEQAELVVQMKATLDDFPRGKNVGLPLQEIVNDTDFFGGAEDRLPWADTVLSD
jgi:hypothetical protein